MAVCKGASGLRPDMASLVTVTRKFRLPIDQLN